MSRRHPGLRPGARAFSFGGSAPPGCTCRRRQVHPGQAGGSGGHGQVTTIGSRAAGWAGTDGVPVAQPPPPAGAPQSGRSSGGHEQLKMPIWL